MTTIAANETSGQIRMITPIARPSRPRTREFVRSVARRRPARSESFPRIATQATSTIEAVPASMVRAYALRLDQWRFHGMGSSGSRSSTMTSMPASAYRRHRRALRATHRARSRAEQSNRIALLAVLRRSEQTRFIVCERRRSRRARRRDPRGASASNQTGFRISSAREVIPSFTNTFRRW
jgi:hypothetical protein